MSSVHIPSTRELELELLLSERDEQLAILTNDITTLRAYLPTLPKPSASQPISLPPSVIPLLGSIIVKHAAPISLESTSVTTALTQRVTILQQENDELYGLLNTSTFQQETKLLRKSVARLESALQESHTIISSLSAELDKTYDVINSRNIPATQPIQRPSRSPTPSSHQSGPSQTHGSSSSKPIPTGPRAQKKPRISGPVSPPPPTAPKGPATSRRPNKQLANPNNHVHGVNPPQHEGDNGWAGSRRGRDHDRSRSPVSRPKERDRRSRSPGWERDRHAGRRNGASKGGGGGGESNVGRSLVDRIKF